MDFNTLSAHVTKIVSVLINEKNAEYISNALDNGRSIVEKFISDASVRILAIDRVAQRGEDTDETAVTYTALIEMHYRKDRLSTIIFLKKGQVIQADTPIEEQMLVTS